MTTFVAAAVLAFLVALVTVPVVARWARRVGALSIPGARDEHERPIPRLGGVAITAATLAPILGLFFVDGSVARTIRDQWGLSLGLVIGGVAVCAVGALDDARPIRARYKLLVQVVAALVAYQLGFRIETLKLPFLGAVELGLLSLPLTLIWIVGVTNAVNLIDGLDGLAAGVVFFAVTANFTVAVINDSVFVALVMSCMGGALLGFLPYNFNPAKIFMGDSGSYFLGFTLGAASLQGAAQKASTTVALLVPILALGLPIFDTLVSMTRRRLEGRGMFTPDRGHIHHRLIDKGLSQRKTVLVLYSVSLILAACAVVVMLGTNDQTKLALFLATSLMVGLVIFARSFSLAHFRHTPAHERLCDLGQRLRQELLQLPVDLHATCDRGEVWRVLERLAESLELTSLSFAALDPEQGDLGWSGPQEDETGHRDRVSATLEVRAGDALLGHLRLGWRSSAEAVNLQTAVLLQLVADHVGHAFARLDDRRAALFEAAAAVEPVADETPQAVQA